MKAGALILALLIAFSSFSQERKASRFRPGFMWFYTGLRPSHKGSPKYDRLMLDLTYNTWKNDSSVVRALPGSIGFNLHTMFDIPLTANDVISIGIGLSYRFQKVKFEGSLNTTADGTGTRIDLYDLPANGLTKYQFRSSSFAVPLELRFRTPRWRHVKLHIGGYFGYRTTVKTKYRLDGDTDVSHRFADANRLVYGLHARIGIRNLAFFVDYSLSPQFTSPSSPKIYPVSAGITLSLF